MNEIGWFNIPKFARAPDAEMKMACALLLGNSSHERKYNKRMFSEAINLISY
jgi:hypothetical protein